MTEFCLEGKRAHSSEAFK